MCIKCRKLEKTANGYDIIPRYNTKELSEKHMYTDWMGSHRQIVREFMNLMNVYAREYCQVKPLYGSPLELSPARIQTLEFILEGNGQKMSEIAARIGIARTTFSNTVKDLEQKGYLKKVFKEGNKKDIYLEVSETGKQIYHEYSMIIYNNWFKHMFDQLDTMSKKDIATLERILVGFTGVFDNTVENSQPERTEYSSSKDR